MSGVLYYFWEDGVITAEGAARCDRKNLRFQKGTLRERDIEIARKAFEAGREVGREADLKFINELGVVTEAGKGMDYTLLKYPTADDYLKSIEGADGK